MNNKKVIIGIVVAVVLLIATGIAIFSMSHIQIDFTLDEFRFMGHSITEGDQLNNILLESDIEYFTGAVCDKDFYAKKDDHGMISIMCPAYHNQDDAPDSTVPEEERRREWISGYSVTDTTIPNNPVCVSITVYANHKNLADYYEGPINIGDTMEEVRNIMQIDAIKRFGIYDKEARYEKYTFVCNQGNVIFEEKCSGYREEYDHYSDKLEYLAEGHYITYMFIYPEYILGIRFGSDGTVDHITTTYDPEGRLDQWMN